MVWYCQECDVLVPSVQGAVSQLLLQNAIVDLFIFPLLTTGVVQTGALYMHIVVAMYCAFSLSRCPKTRSKFALASFQHGYQLTSDIIIE